MENNDVILAAINEHGEKFQKAQHALAQQNVEAGERLNGLEQEFATLKAAGNYRGDNGPEIASPVAEFLKSAQLKGMQDGAAGTGRVTLDTSGVRLLTKAISNTGVGQTGDNAYSVQAQRWNGLGNNPQRKLSLFDVLPSIPVGVNTFEYMQLNGYTNAAAIQAKEGDTKAEASVSTQVVTANIATIAAFVRTSLQVMNDAPALGAQLNNLLSYGVMAKAESELINGTAGAGKIKGLLASATAFTPTSDEAQDMIGEAITELEANGWSPSVVIMNPHDFGAIQRARGTTNDGYLLGSPRDPSPPSLWSVPVITSASLAAGTALVLDGQQVAVLDRQQVVIASSREDGSNFVSNQITVLAEGRMGLAVFSTGAVLSVDLTPTT